MNGRIQDAFALRELYEQLGDPKYTAAEVIFDIMAYTVIQRGLDLVDAAYLDMRSAALGRIHATCGCGRWEVRAR